MTDRLRLRRLRPGDADAVVAYVSDWDVAKQTGDIPYPYSETAARDWIGREMRDWARGKGCALAIEDRETGAFIGTVSFRLRNSRLTLKRAEVGYWIGKPHWNKGYATEAVGVAVPWFSETLRARRVEAVTFADNEGSIQVLNKLGFRKIRATTRAYPDRGGPRAVEIYLWMAPSRRWRDRRDEL